MQVREGMSDVVLTIGPDHKLREAARQMAKRGVGAAVVIDPEEPGPGIITERDILQALADGQSPDNERVSDHLSAHLVFAEPSWSLERAAEEMVRGGFRHLVVVDGGETVGVLSMRDIVRCWTGAGATCDVPEGANAAQLRERRFAPLERAIARGSYYELEHWLARAHSRGLLASPKTDELGHIGRALSGLIRRL